MNKQNTVLYVGNFEFPLGNAAGKRVYGNACALRDYGFRVICLGVSKEGLQSHYSTTKSEYDGLEFYKAKYSNGLTRLSARQTYQQFIKFIKDIEIEKDLHTVIMYGSLSIALWNVRVARWCKKRKIQVVGDYVDWHNPWTRNPLFNIFKTVDICTMLRYVSVITDKNIVISDYLNERIRNDNIVIPPLCHKTQLCAKKERLFVYAGSPFRTDVKGQNPKHFKDRIDIMINLMYEQFRRGGVFHFDIYGFTREQYIKALRHSDRVKQEEYLSEMGDCIEFHGRTDAATTQNAVSRASYSILIRNNNRMTNAGFSTKISEAISYGTFVITNSTSDVKKYIHDNINGVILSDQFEVASEQIFSLLSCDGPNNLLCEKDTFCYENYINQLGTFITREN